MDLSQPKTCKNTDIIILHVRRVMCVRQEFRSKPFLLNQAMDKESQHTGLVTRDRFDMEISKGAVFLVKNSKSNYINCKMGDVQFVADSLRCMNYRLIIEFRIW